MSGLRTQWLPIAFLAACSLPTSPAAELRPTSVTWGGYNGNEQLVGADDQWPFVQKYMDGYVMHGAYWLSQRNSAGAVADADLDASLAALGRALSAHHKLAHVETGLVENDRDYDPANAAKRSGSLDAEKHIARFHHWASVGVHVGKVRVDWFPMQAVAVYAQHFETTDTATLMERVTGDAAHWGAHPGVNPAQANWLEYATKINAAFPQVQLGFDQAPCNFFSITPDPALRSRMPWPSLGWGYRSDGLKFLYTKKQAMVDGHPVAFSLDFADLLMSVATSSRSQGLNFAGFDGDTPYTYITDNKGRQGKQLMPFLLSIEQLLHRNGPASGKIINDNFPLADMTHDQWDQHYHDRTMEFLETYQAAGGRADQYIAESWHAGPYTYFPETKPGTFSNLARDLIRRIRGIDDSGTSLPLGLTAEAVTGGTRVTLTNSTDYRAAPLLRATARNASTHLAATDGNGKDITDALLARGDADGYFVNPIDSGHSVTLTLSGQGTLEIAAYWNPQDPSLKLRASVNVSQ